MVYLFYAFLFNKTKRILSQNCDILIFNIYLKRSRIFKIYYDNSYRYVIFINYLDKYVRITRHCEFINKTTEGRAQCRKQTYTPNKCAAKIVSKMMNLYKEQCNSLEGNWHNYNNLPSGQTFHQQMHMGQGQLRACPLPITPHTG